MSRTLSSLAILLSPLAVACGHSGADGDALRIYEPLPAASADSGMRRPVVASRAAPTSMLSAEAMEGSTRSGARDRRDTENDPGNDRGAHDPVEQAADAGSNAGAETSGEPIDLTGAKLTVSVAGGKRCMVKLGRERLGRTPLETTVPAGRFKVVVQCGKKKLFSKRLAFSVGAHRLLMLDKNKRKKRRRSARTPIAMR